MTGFWTGGTHKAGSLQILSGANSGAKTDQVGDDQGEYDGTDTVTVRLGTGADGTNGGTLAIGQTTVIQFVVTVDGNAGGTISNQADITYAGQQGAPQQVIPTDGNGGGAGGGTGSTSGVAGGGGTSSGLGGGTSSGDYYPGDSIGQEGSCGCSAPGSRKIHGLGILAALGLVAALRRRRRAG